MAGHSAEVPGMPGDQAALPKLASPPQAALFLSDHEQQVVDALFPTEADAFLKLTDKHRATFARLFLAVGDDDSAKTSLSVMMLSGRLFGKDHQQRSLAGLFDQFLTLPLDCPAGQDPQIHRTSQLAVLIRQVHHPTVIDQGNHETCGAASAQIDLATNFSTHYVAFAMGLLSTSAQGTLPGGLTLRRVPDSLEGRPHDPRPTVSRLIQASFMHLARSGDYADRESEKGILPTASDDLHRALRGEGVSYLVDDSWYTLALGGFQKGVRHETLLRTIAHDVARQKAKGRPTPLVPASLRWGERNGHQVMVTHMTGQRVYVINPHPNQFTYLSHDPDATKGVEKEGPKQGMTYYEGPYPTEGPGPVRVYADGTQSFPKAVFDRHLFGAVVSTQAANQAKRHDRPAF